MAKLHEVLAIERGLQAVANKLTSESLKTLSKDSLFKGQTRTLTHFSDEDAHLNGQEHQSLETTVGENLDYLKKPWSEWVDAVASKDKANMEAAADVLIDGKVFIAQVPATTLLGLESKLSTLRGVLESIPTLPPGVSWITDSQEREGVYRSEHSTTSIKEVKDTEYRKVAEATEQHPAQVAGVNITKAVGKYEVKQQCGMMSPVEKAAHLERLDTIIKAVKKARARANEQSVDPVDMGGAIFDFVRGVG